MARTTKISDADPVLELLAEWEEQCRTGLEPDLDVLCAEHPGLREELQWRIERRRRLLLKSSPRRIF